MHASFEALRFGNVAACTRVSREWPVEGTAKVVFQTKDMDEY
jgi:hypothetical protein